MTGTVRVPRGKSASVYIDIFGPEKVALAGSGWRFTVLRSPFGLPNAYELVRRFSQDTSPLSLKVAFDTCNCVNYTSPYLVATTANVQTIAGGSPPSVPGLPPISGAPWTVTLGFRGSEVDLRDISIPADLNILAAYPQPTNTAAPGDWSWPGAAYGSVTAIDLGASASRDMNLFYAGLLLGIAGSAVVGLIQALFTVLDVKGRTSSKDSNDSTATNIDVKGQAHSVSLQHVTSQVTREMEASIRWLLDRVQADADKRQAVYDRVLRDGRGKSVAQVRGLLAREWRATFGTDISEAELSENAKVLAAGNRIQVVGLGEEVT
jgi:hypothetical protein